jgi:uncharacterized membrane protein
VTPEVQILVWWLLFGGTHIVGSTVPVRTFLIEKIGLRGFKGLYSLVSFVTFVPLCYVYFTNQHAGRLLFAPPENMYLITEVLMILGFVVLVQGLTTPSPLTTEAEMSGHFPDRARGIQRITRHPGNFGFALIGIAHMVSNPYVGDWIFWGGFVVYALLSSIHQDRRTLASGREEIAEYQAQTSLIPFAAILRGKQQFAFNEYRLIPLIVSLVICAAIWYFHASIFGGYGS